MSDNSEKNRQDSEKKKKSNTRVPAESTAEKAIKKASKPKDPKKPIQEKRVEANEDKPESGAGEVKSQEKQKVLNAPAEKTSVKKSDKKAISKTDDTKKELKATVQGKTPVAEDEHSEEDSQEPQKEEKSITQIPEGNEFGLPAEKQEVKEEHTNKTSSDTPVENEPIKNVGKQERQNTSIQDKKDKCGLFQKIVDWVLKVLELFKSLKTKTKEESKNAKVKFETVEKTPKQTVFQSDEKRQSQQKNEPDEQDIMNDADNNQDLSEQTQTADTTANSKQLVDGIKSTVDVIKGIAYIGTTIVALLSAVKVFFYHIYYGIPMINLSNLSVLYSVLIHSILVGIIIYLIFTNYYLLIQKPLGKPFFDITDKIINSLFAFAVSLLAIIFAYYYGFEWKPIANFLGEKWKIFLLIVFSAHVIFLYCVPSIMGFILNSKKNPTNHKGSTVQNSATSNEKTRSATIKKMSWVMTLVLSFLLSIIFVCLAFCRIMQSEWFPDEDCKFEITKIGMQTYVTVCNTSNGRLVVKCDEIDEYGQSKLLIYKSEYEYIEVKGHVFCYKSYDIVSNDGIWYFPDNNKEEPHRITVEFSDYVAGEYRLKTKNMDMFYVKIKNKDKENYVVGSYYNLEIFQNGKWRYYSSAEPVKSFIEPYELGIGETTYNFSYDLSVFGELNPGHYRIACCDDGSGQNYHYVEFTINSCGDFNPL